MWVGMGEDGVSRDKENMMLVSEAMIRERAVEVYRDYLGPGLIPLIGLVTPEAPPPLIGLVTPEAPPPLSPPRGVPPHFEWLLT